MQGINNRKYSLCGSFFSNGMYCFIVCTNVFFLIYFFFGRFVLFCIYYCFFNFFLKCRYYLSMEQILERDGTEIVPPDVQRYVNLSLVKYIEEECTFIVIEGLHRLIVSFFKCNICFRDC